MGRIGKISDDWGSMSPFVGGVEDGRGIVGLGGGVELRKEGGTIDYAKMEGLGEFAWLLAREWKGG